VDPHRWPFSGTDGHPLHAINQTLSICRRCRPLVALPNILPSIMLRKLVWSMTDDVWVCVYM